MFFRPAFSMSSSFTCFSSWLWTLACRSPRQRRAGLRLNRPGSRTPGRDCFSLRHGSFPRAEFDSIKCVHTYLPIRPNQVGSKHRKTRVRRWRRKSNERCDPPASCIVFVVVKSRNGQAKQPERDSVRLVTRQGRGKTRRMRRGLTAEEVKAAIEVVAIWDPDMDWKDSEADCRRVHCGSEQGDRPPEVEAGRLRLGPSLAL